MTYDLMRRAAAAMRREHTPFHDAVAAWLEDMARTHEGDLGDYCAGKGHSLDFDGVGPLEPCTSWWCSNVTSAFAVADAFLADPGDLPEEHL